MRPVRLYMKNIGPYLDEQIDFSSLENMFLIKGDTGAGKTFIFDAITYALYGSLCGGRKSHESDFKSRYASQEDESYVEFEFNAGGKKYLVMRTVPFKYENKNGKTAKKSQEACLFEISENSRIEFNGKLSELNEKIQNIIGLDANEFSQIILLPQGKFAEFLHKNSKERSETLRTLFPVDFYTNITERIKEKYKAEEENLSILEGMILSSESAHDFSNADETIKKSGSEILSLENDESEAQKKLSALAAKKEGLSHEIKNSLEFEENKKSLEDFKARKNDFDFLKKKISLAEKALALKEYISAAQNAGSAEKSADENLKSAVLQNDSAKKALSELELKKDEMSALLEKNRLDEGNLSVLKQKIDDAKNLPDLIKKEGALKIKIEENKKNADTVQKNLDEENRFLEGKSAVEISAALNENLSSLRENKNLLQNESAECKNRDRILAEKKNAEKELAETKARLEAEQEKLARTNKAIVELESKKNDQEIKNKAYSLSLSLKPLCPCPVCGSADHPSPAFRPEKFFDYDGQIKTHKENLDSVQTALTSFLEKKSVLNEKIRKCASLLSEIKTARTADEVLGDLEKISVEIDSLEDKLLKVQKANRKILEYEKNLSELKEKSSKDDKDYLETMTMRQTLEKSLGSPLEAAVKNCLALENELFKNKKIYEQWENACKSAGSASQKAEAKAEEAQKQALEAKKNLSAAEENLLEKIAGSVFATVEEAEGALMETSEIEAGRKSYENFIVRLNSISDAVEKAKVKNLKPSAQIISELDFLKNEETKTRDALLKIRTTLDEKKNEFLSFKNDFENLEKKKSERDVLLKKIAPLKKLNADLSGQNPLKLKFETWALGMYFEQVVSFASRRFFDISGGRFSFELSGEKSSGNSQSGLELRVFDSHSGKYCDPAELSGGETFEASVSLALALTDVVQNSSGGIQLDSLFIDEGFGTLDPETLEKAMSVLTELSETKMIGMISHVSEMEDFPDIKSVLKVKKTNQGSTVTVEAR